MFRTTIVGVLLCFWLLTSHAFTVNPAVVTTEQARAELVVNAPNGLVPEQKFQMGLLIEHRSGWHTYWKNPGDSGLPTRLDWTLPGGMQAGDIEWPLPRRLPIGPLMNYGYDGRVLLPVTVTVPAGFSGDSADIRLRAEWLVCKEICIPQSGEFRLKVPAATPTTNFAQAFDIARDAIPAPLATAYASARVQGHSLVLRIDGLPAAWRNQNLSVFAEVGAVLDNASRPVAQWDAGVWTASLPLSAQRSVSPDRLPLVLVADSDAVGVQVTVDVAGPWPSTAAPSVVGLETNGVAPRQGADLGWIAALAFALVGGALLNLMPCVFPVLSLKVLGFAAHAHDRRVLIGNGLAYSAGVVLSFLALAGLLLALRAGGEQLGWGFQLQSPAVVATLAALFTMIGLNLLGVYEFGSLLPSSLATVRFRHPMVDSMLTGVLAVAVASPCTAPFMGASLGLAATLPAPQALAVFSALGLGMALPVLAVSAWPALARALPRPGVWMVHFRVAMAFPIFGTVVWLAWVLGQQAGVDAVALLLGVLLALAFSAWALGSATLGPGARKTLGTLSVALLAVALAWFVPTLSVDDVQVSRPAATTAATQRGWRPWSTTAVADELAQGRPVFIDFTAAWCVTCQFNKRTTLDDARVLADFAARGVTRMRADWTRRDPAITAELARLGRNGVPVYALYTPAQPDSPRLLKEILTVSALREALADLPTRAASVPGAPTGPIAAR